jgi:hypothetical protein
VVRYNNRLLQLERQRKFYAPAASKVTVQQWRDGSLHLLYRGRPIGWREIDPLPKAQEARQEKPATPLSLGRQKPKPDHASKRQRFLEMRPRKRLAA